MALILKNSIFYHVPRTGGTWVGTVLRRAKLVQEEYIEAKHPMDKYNLRREHVSPLFADKFFVEGKKSFAFVRSPITWYQSFWKYKQANNGWDEPYLEYFDNDFNKFMRKFMDITPGFLTHVYQEFQGVDMLGKFENLKKDLVKILKFFDEDFDPDFIIDYPVVNNSPPSISDSKFNCEYKPEILKEMKEKERWIFEKYYKNEI